MSKVGIVLVNYNGEKFQNECIRTLKNQTYKNYEIIVVDNNSSDNSVKNLKEEFPDVTLIETGENAGVAKGNNIGIKYALKNDCEYVLLLNNDTEVDKNLIKYLVKEANESTLVTCKMYYYKPGNMIWCSGGKINWDKATTTHFGDGEIDQGQYNENQYVEYTPTCCLLIHRKVFEDVGLMDEKYFMYYDDTDFCVRVNKKGYKILYNHEAFLFHKVSSSSGGKTSLTTLYYGDRNRLYFIDKFYKNNTKVKIYYYSTRILKLINWMIKGEKSKVSTLIRAIRDYKSNQFGLKRGN